MYLHTQMPPSVLVVDDDKNVVNAVARLLRVARLNVLTAVSGAAAVEILVSHSVDVIVSDSLMHPVTGIELFRKSKSLFPEIATILLSGQSCMVDILQAKREGILYAYIPKPWDNDELLATIHGALARFET